MTEAPTRLWGPNSRRTGGAGEFCVGSGNANIPDELFKGVKLRDRTYNLLSELTRRRRSDGRWGPRAMPTKLAS
jgi:hypothetical protein